MLSSDSDFEFACQGSDCQWTCFGAVRKPKIYGQTPTHLIGIVQSTGAAGRSKLNAFEFPLI